MCVQMRLYSYNGVKISFKIQTKGQAGVLGKFSLKASGKVTIKAIYVFHVTAFFLCNIVQKMPAATQLAYQQISSAFSYLSNLALDRRRYKCFMQKRNPTTDFIK